MKPNKRLVETGRGVVRILFRPTLGCVASNIHLAEPARVGIIFFLSYFADARQASCPLMLRKVKEDRRSYPQTNQSSKRKPSYSNASGSKLKRWTLHIDDVALASCAGHVTFIQLPSAL